MRVNLFDIDKNGKAKITNHVKGIWYLNHILEKYGEDISLKIFQIFDKVHNLNYQINPFANIEDDKKFETVLRSTYPELETLVDLEEDIILRALDLVEELYSTESYRAYQVIKTTYNKLNNKIKYSNLSIDKDTGNMGELSKALSLLPELKKQMSVAYTELEEEMDLVKFRGKKTTNDRRNNGKDEELD